MEIGHSREAKADLEFYSRLTLEMAAAQERTLDAFRRMTTAPVAQPQAEEIITSVWPDPPKPRRVEQSERLDLAALAAQAVAGAADRLELARASAKAWELAREHQLAVRTLCREALAKFNDEHSRFANTAWAVYNACTETSDWRKGRGKVAESVLFGERAAEKMRAYGAIAELVGIDS